MNMTLREIQIDGAPPLQCRTVVSSLTFAHIAGIPFKPEDGGNHVGLQRLETRVPRQFGKVPYCVLDPELIPQPSGTLAFPKVERMAFLLAEDTAEALVMVWFGREDTVFMSDGNMKQLNAIHWQDHARRIEMNR
ncbi:MAG: hypothetical protein NTV49_12220 [Kiritimatiellaeota bacterium]|nr:hypothetical protein [Kiritimatiellota bacterium]